ncbi:Protein tssc1 [Polyrhizophydium stewartii]|uniref:Protein tssc1 n=1 Tax=Polyrhizophydium stewartii TaxID=2732419 RepID=A0ABR4N0D0_9FUNG
MLVPPSTAVQVHLIDFDEDHDEITHAAFAHPNEVLSISPAPAAADVFASCARQVAGAATSHQSLLWRFSKIDAEDDGRLRGGSGGSLEQVSALSPGSQLTAIHQVVWEPSGSASELVAIGKSGAGVFSLSGPDMVASFSHMIMLAPEPMQTPICGAWSPHSRSQIALGSGNTVGVWDLRSKSESARIDKAHELSVRCLDFNPNKAHQIVSGGDDCKIRIWDTRNTKTFVKEVSDHTHWVWSVSFNRSHDQLLLSSSSDCQVNLTSVVSVSSAVFFDPSQRAHGESGSPDGRARRSSDDEDATEYQSKTTDGLVASFDQHEEAVYSVAWSAADPWIFASLSYDGRVVVNQVPRDHKYKIIL